jgi:hypothetical protein
MRRHATTNNAAQVLLRYRTARNYTTPAYVLPRVAEKLLFAGAMLSLYYGKGKDFSMANAPVLASLLFLSVLGPSCCAMIYLPSMSMERALFIRERNDGLYRPLVYLIFKLCDEGCLLVPVTAVAAAAVFLGCRLQGSFVLYWLVQLATLANGTGARPWGWRWLRCEQHHQLTWPAMHGCLLHSDAHTLPRCPASAHLAVLFAALFSLSLTHTHAALAFFLAAATPGLMVAMPLLSLTLVLKLLLCGFMIRTAALPVYWRWAVRLNFVHYGWRALMANQWAAQPQELQAQATAAGQVTSVLGYFGERQAPRVPDRASTCGGSQGHRRGRQRHGRWMGHTRCRRAQPADCACCHTPRPCT